MATLTREQIEQWRRICLSHWAANSQGEWLSHEESERQANALCDMALSALRASPRADPAITLTVRESDMMGRMVRGNGIMFTAYTDAGKALPVGKYDLYAHPPRQCAESVSEEQPVVCPKCNADESTPCAYPNGHYRDCPQAENRRKVGAEVAAQIVEMCAKVCDERTAVWVEGDRKDLGRSREAAVCATRIRALSPATQGSVVVPRVRLEEICMILQEAASVIEKLPEDKWEKFGARDFLADELSGCSSLLNDTLAASKGVDHE